MSTDSVASGWAKALGGDRKQFNMFFDRMLDGFAYHKIVVDKAGKPVDYVFLEVNHAFEKMTGLKRERIIGKRVTEILPGIEKDPADWIGVYGKVALTGEPVQFENHAETLGKWFKVVAYCPEKGHFVALFEDITERKKAEEALASANKELEGKVQKRTLEVSSERQRLYSILETLPVYVILLDKNYRVPFANKVFRERFGESLGRACYAFLFNLESPCKNCETYKVLKTSGPHRWEWTGPDGHDYDIYDFPFIEADGSTLILEMGIDITERKRAEKQVRDASFYSRSLLEASLDPLVTISVEGKITDVNQATELVTGCSREELIGSDFLDYFTEPKEAEKGYKQVFTEGFVRDYPLAIRHKSGKITDVLYNATIYTNEVGEMQGVFAAARDITEFKKAEEQAQEAAKKLKDSERLAAIGATAGMVGHDIRNPLQAITGDLFLAKTELASLPENEQKMNALESLDEIEHNIDYINKIVADLQDYARPLNPRAQETNIKLLFNEILVKNGIPKNIRLIAEVEDKAEKIMADPDYLKRIVANLTLNAIQAMPDGGKLTIHAYADKATDDVLITVKDTGVGIPEDIKPKLFTPMMTTKSKGQGFGLAVVKRMTEGLGGTVTFVSTEGKGTTFIVRLPPPRS
jgi:PAS domain S-box-containing protein